MSWHYSQELGAGFSLPNYLDGLRSARSKSSSTHATSSCDGRKTDTSNHSRSGTMFAPSTGDRGGGQLMLFQVDSPAKTSARQVKVQDLPETVADFGLSISESLTRCGLALSSPKTLRTCVPVGLAPSSKDLSRWGMVFDGECWELGTSVRLISETECGYLPTPRSTDGSKGSRTIEGAKREYCRGKNKDLGMFVAMWPTPTVVQRPNEGNMRLVRARAVAGEISWEEAEAMVGKDVRLPHGKLKEYLPTTQASDHITKRTSKSWKEQGRVNFTLSNPEIQKMWPTPTLAAQAGGRLNPDWTEWLMAWPIGWTDSKPLATDKFRQWRQSHGKH